MAPEPWAGLDRPGPVPGYLGRSRLDRLIRLYRPRPGLAQAIQTIQATAQAIQAIQAKSPGYSGRSGCSGDSLFRPGPARGGLPWPPVLKPRPVENTASS